LAHKDLETLTIPDQATYKGQTMTFKAIPITALFQRVDRGMVIEFDTLDGFSASLDPELLLNRDSKGAIAYLAVEEPGKPWPKLGKGGTAGPLYLVWKNPELSKVGQEQWPYQLRSFTIKPPLEQRFPEVLPASDLADDDPARLGYEVFVKNCFACHTLNGQGNGRLGPDLNIPHSPTEYLHEEYLRKLVRNPQSVRQWKGSKMSAFSEDSLPDRDLDLIIAYLKHKAAQRRAAK
jgi:mono/diheme cytochrome c family protein